MLGIFQTRDVDQIRDPEAAVEALAIERLRAKIGQSGANSGSRSITQGEPAVFDSTDEPQHGFQKLD